MFPDQPIREKDFHLTVLHLVCITKNGLPEIPAGRTQLSPPVQSGLLIFCKLGREDLDISKTTSKLS